MSEAQGPPTDPTGANLGEKADPANPSNIMIGIMGPTGTGKSSFIARLTGNKSIKIGHGVGSATSEIGHYNYFVEGRCVTLVDSPGFDDSREGATDTDILRKIAAFLELEFNQDKRLSGIIYLHRITDPRMGGVSLRNLRMFRKLCGDDALKNVVVVTTRWDDVQEEDTCAMETREKELMETPGEYFGPLIAVGGGFLRHDNTAGSARRIVEALLKNHPIPLQIQLEMHEGKPLEETAAGTELAAELKKLMDKHSREMKNLKEEMEEAIAAKDKALKEELEAERTKMQKEMTIWEGQKKALADGLTAAREDAKKRQADADRKLREQGAEFDRKVKEAETRAEEERRKLKAGMAKMSAERQAADQKLKDLENDRISAASRSRGERARIQLLVEAAQKEKDATDRKHLVLLRSMRVQICHWEPFSGKFNSASFISTPIESSPRRGVSEFIVRLKRDARTGIIYSVREGGSIRTYHGGVKFWDFQVLVGDASRLCWVSIHGRFEPKLIGYNPVLGWDEEVDEVSETGFIARFFHLGAVYTARVLEGDNDVSWKTVGSTTTLKAQDYEVLCYKDL